MECTNDDQVNSQVNGFVTHSHTDEHVRCKIKEEAISSTFFDLIFICYYLVFAWPDLAQTQILSLKVTPNRFLSGVPRYFQLNLHCLYI